MDDAGPAGGLKTALVAGLLVFAGAGCVSSSRPASVTPPEEEPIETQEDASVGELAKGMRDWCGPYMDAKKFFGNISWAAMDDAVSAKRDEGWGDLGVCIRRPISGYSEYGHSYADPAAGRGDGWSPATSTLVYFKMGMIGSPEDRDRVERGSFVSTDRSKRLESRQVMLLGYWDTERSDVRFSRPVATGWVGEYGGFQAIHLVPDLSAKRRGWAIKGDTVYAADMRPSAADTDDPYEGLVNVIATFDPEKGTTTACLADEPTCH